MSPPSDPDLVAEHVLRCVECIPTGRVAAYGQIGRIVGVGPRQVGSIMAGASDVPWWRVTNSTGDVPAHLRARARDHWLREQITWKTNGFGCRIADYQTDLDALADDYLESVRDLPACR